MAKIPQKINIKKCGTLFTAEYNGEILGGHLYLNDESNIKLCISASKRLHGTKEKATLIGDANRLLHWEVIKYAEGFGIKEFNWGGLWPANEANKSAIKKSVVYAA